MRDNIMKATMSVFLWERSRRDHRITRTQQVSGMWRGPQNPLAPRRKGCFQEIQKVEVVVARQTMKWGDRMKTVFLNDVVTFLGVVLPPAGTLSVGVVSAPPFKQTTLFFMATSVLIGG